MAKRHVVRVFRVKMSEPMANRLDKLVEEGIYISYADAIRHGLGLLFEDAGSELPMDLTVSSGYQIESRR